MQTLMGLALRHALTVLAGYLAAKSGGVDPASIGSAITVLAGIGWSLLQKHNAGIKVNPFS